MALNHAEVIQGLRRAVAGGGADFPAAFLAAFGASRATLRLLSSRDIAKDANETALPGKIWLRVEEPGADLAESLAAVRARPEYRRASVRFALVTDGRRMLAHDEKFAESLEAALEDLPENYEFFLPLTGLYEKAGEFSGSPADARACEKMGEIYDGIMRRNPGFSDHDANVFLTRLLFCLFAEDGGIFPGERLMSGAIAARTQTDGSDLEEFFEALFAALDMPPGDARRAALPAWLRAFPYVDGALFAEKSRVPRFDYRLRYLLLSCGGLRWAEISPAIFGSMFQAVMDAAKRRGLGAHYTSEKNILRLIRPLFLDDLREELAAAKKARNPAALLAFLQKLSETAFLDPACGCGNFLVVAYRELRELEIDAFAALASSSSSLIDNPAYNSKDDPETGASHPNSIASLRSKRGVKGGSGAGGPRRGSGQSPNSSSVPPPFSRISLDNFRGIEIEEFPARIARVSLWLTEFMLDLRLGRVLGREIASLPLRSGAAILNADALETDWRQALPEGAGKTYIFGNPPFGGSSTLTPARKAQMRRIFGARGGKLDYVAAWFEKAAAFMRENPAAEAAFVATNSVCQGEQTAPLWEKALEDGLRINFAWRTFPWSNEARGKAAVNCVIVGFSMRDRPQKTIFTARDGQNEAAREICREISPYLVAGSPLAVRAEREALFAPLPMLYGNKPADGGHLIIEAADYEKFLARAPQAAPWVKKLIGSEEFLHKKPRHCLWLVDAPPEILELPEVAARIEAVRRFRLKSRKAATRRDAATPHLFQEVRLERLPENTLVIPRVSSERRPYIPIGFCGSDAVVADSCHTIPGAGLYEFAILTSSTHFSWMRLVCGRLEMRYRYSRDLCYNTFPWPCVNAAQRESLALLGGRALELREKFPQMTLAAMYDPETMPKELREIHREIDQAVAALYGARSLADDENGRLALLLGLYEKGRREKPRKQAASGRRAGEASHA